MPYDRLEPLKAAWVKIAGDRAAHLLLYERTAMRRAAVVRCSTSLQGVSRMSAFVFSGTANQPVRSARIYGSLHDQSPMGLMRGTLPRMLRCGLAHPSDRLQTCALAARRWRAMTGGGPGACHVSDWPVVRPLWRYRELLPARSNRRLRQGFTPLLPPAASGLRLKPLHRDESAT
jgi:hypothetical protein